MVRASLLLVLLFLPFTSRAQIFPGNYSGHSIEGRAIRVRAGASSVRFMFYKPDVVRIDFLPVEQTIPDSSFVVIRDTSEGVAWSVSSSDSTLQISTSAVTIRINKNPLRISYLNSSGQLLLAEPNSGGLATLYNERSASFTMSAEDHFYGTGERGTGLDKRGLAFDVSNQQIGGYNTPLPTMNLNVPFVASTKGYALYFDNTYPGRFDFGVSSPNQFFYLAGGGELTYYLIVAPSVRDQLERYTWLTGRQPLPPKWAFGFIQSKFGYRNDAEARAMVLTMRQKQIPCDAIVLDLYWFRNMGDLSWNLSAFPNPQQMMSDFLSTGIKTIVITEPYVVASSGNFSTGSALGNLARNQSGLTYQLSNWWSCNCPAGLLDMTKPEARHWWWNFHPQFFGNNLAGIWTDLGEPERHPDDMMHTLGATAKVHNIYNLLWSKTIFEGYQQFRPNQRLFNLTRSGFAGSQRYATIPWSGDVGRSFGGLAVQLPMMLNMGISGFAYHNSDIGGFTNGTTTPELYIRWMQYGTFCPITRAHGAGPGVGGQDTEPWGFGQGAESIAKKYIELRYRLLPYIYTLAHKSYATGLPLARPLVLDYQNDSRAGNESSTYLWGDEILVSPVVAAGQTTKLVYLPLGKWIDFWTEQQYEGPRFASVQAPIEILPLFVKSGSVIPMQSVMNYVDERPLDTLSLAIYPAVGIGGDFILYEDDGETLAYASGASAETRFTHSTAAGDSGVRITTVINPTIGLYAGKPMRRVYLVELHGATSLPTAVTNNGRPILQRYSYEELRTNGDGFFFDIATHRLFVHIPTVPDSAYRIVAQNVQLTSVGGGEEGLANEYRLAQNFPNPFNPTTIINYQIPVTSHVTLKVFDVLGKEVATLVDALEQPGYKSVQWTAGRVASGIYFYRLQAGNFVATKKLVVLQ